MKPEKRHILLSCLFIFSSNILFVLLLKFAFVDKAGSSDPIIMFLSVILLSTTGCVATYLVLRKYRDEKKDEQRKAQHFIEKREKHFQALIENTEDIISLHNADGTTIYISPAFERISGFSWNEVKGKTLFDFMPPDRQAIARERLGMLVASPNLALKSANLFRTKGDKYIAIEGTITNRLEDENVRAIVCNFRDISEKRKTEAHIKESEALYSALFRNMMHGFGFCKAHMENGQVVDYTYLTVNPAFERLTGMKDVVGKRISEAIPNLSHTNTDVFINISKVIATGKPQTFETFVPALSRWFSVSVYSPKEDHFATIFDDITEKKKLDEQKSLISSIVSHSEDAIYSHTTEGVITSWNKGAEKLYGYSPEEVIGLKTDTLIPVNRLGEKTEFQKKVNAGLHVKNFETQRMTKENDLIHVSLTVSPLIVEGKLGGASVVARNITEKKAIEEKIMQSEENLRTIFENTMQGFILLGPDGTVKTLNDNAQVMATAAYGRELEVGKIIYDFIEPHRVDYLHQAITEVLRGETIQYNRNYYWPNGQSIWIDFTLSPVWRDNRISGICIAGSDITEKKFFENQREFDKNNLESLINNTGDLMWSIDRDHRLITFNNPFEESIYTTTGMRLSKGDNVLIPAFGEEMLDQYKRQYKRAFAGETFTEVQCNIVNETTYWSETSYYPIYKREEIVGTACFSRDITDRKRYEESQRRNAIEKEIFIEELSQNNQDLKQFAYITSHNLRGPIASLLGLSNLLGNFEIKEQNLLKILEGIQKSALRFDETIRDLNTILTVKENAPRKSEPLLMIDKFQKSMEQCEALIEQNNVSIHYDFDEAPEVWFNRSYLESIFMNLLTNAIKYRDENRPLQITTRTEIEGEFIVLYFEDNGIGMDMRLNQEKLFKLYQRFNTNTEGKGLGLFLIKSQLETYGGSIAVESELNKGTKFILKFRKQPTP